MKKFVLKIIGITLLAIFALVALTYSVLLIFAPGVIADFHNKIGNYNKAALYAYKKYDSSKDVADLDKACKFAVKTENDLTITKYLSVLVDEEGFYDYCLKSETLGAEYYDFMCGKYVCAYYEGQTEKTAVCDKANALSKSYSENCALRALLFKAADKADKTTLQYIKGLLSARTQNALTEKDIAAIDRLLSE